MEPLSTLNSKSPTGGHANHPAIPRGGNLNSYTTFGTYVVASDAIAETITNMPKAASGTLYVLDHGGINYITQLYIPTTSMSIVYNRTYAGGTWSSWSTLASVNVASTSKTTSAGGNTSYNLPRSGIVLQAWCNLSDTVVIPYPASGTGVNGATNWWFHVQSVSGAAVASQSITLVVAYMPLI